MLAALRARALPASFALVATTGIGAFSSFSDIKFTRFAVQADAPVPDNVPVASPEPTSTTSSSPALTLVAPKTDAAVAGSNEAVVDPDTSPSAVPTDASAAQPAVLAEVAEPAPAVTVDTPAAAPEVVDAAAPAPTGTVDAAVPTLADTADAAVPATTAVVDSTPAVSVGADDAAPAAPPAATTAPVNEDPAPAATTAPVTVEAPAAPAPAPEVVEPAAPQINRLTPKEWTPLTLLEKNQLTHNTWIFRFQAHPNEDGSPLFPTASCLMIRGFAPDPKGEAKPIVRPYTPVNRETENETVDLVIKVYPTGKMGNLIAGLTPGESIDFKGPLMKFPYQTNMKKNIGMLAAGTGITPMLQVAQRIVEDPEDKTQVSLIFANISENDILCREQLDELQAKSNGQFKVYYTLEQLKHGGAFWKGGRGRINKNMVDKLLPGPSDESLVMVCGPPGFMEAMSGNKTPDRKQGELKGFLKDLGYSPEQVFKF